MKYFKFYSNIDQVDNEKWRDFYKNHSQSNPYQTFEMFDFWGNQRGCSSFIFFLESNNGECLAFCTGAIVFKGKGRAKFQSKSALIYRGPLVDEEKNKKEILDYLLPKIEKSLKLRSKYIEFRNLSLDSDFKEVFIKNKWRHTTKVSYIVKLTSEEKVFKKFHSRKRTQIRKAFREGVEISYDKSYENIKGVYNVLFKIIQINYDQWLLPVPSLDFLFNLLLLENSGIVTVKFKNKIIGGGIFLFDKRTIHLWFRAGLHDGYRHQSPDSVADWTIMKYGLKEKVQIFDFGGAGVKGKENSLRSYKSRFGSELVENNMYSKLNYPLLYKIENRIFKIIRPLFKIFLA